MKTSFKTEYSDYLILGAGAAGLALTAYLKKMGKEVVCLEAHRTPGGCAGYFDRGKFSFNAGATTLSGLTPNGPLKLFLSECGINPPLTKIDPGIVISLGSTRLKRFSDLSLWIKEQQRVFEHGWIEKLWQQINSTSENAWALTEESKYYPPRKFSDLAHLASQNLSQKFQALPKMLTSFDQHFLKNKDIPQCYRFLLDEQLLISTQSTSREVSALVGSMGLCYPQDTWYPVGGMKTFFSELAKNLPILYQHKFLNYYKECDHFVVTTDQGLFKTRCLITTIPIENEQEGWGAITGYYKIKLKNPNHELYHQIHTHQIPHAGSGSLFASLSAPDDLVVSDGVHQTLTVSTHLDIGRYQKALAIEGRDVLKKEWNKSFHKILRSYFAENLLELIDVGIGDPKTFEKYTHRFQGRVGGLPHTRKRTLLNYPGHETKIKNFYRAGDNTFPGQGIPGVIQGARDLISRLS